MKKIKAQSDIQIAKKAAIKKLKTQVGDSGEERLFFGVIVQALNDLVGISKRLADSAILFFNESNFMFVFYAESLDLNPRWVIELLVKLNLLETKAADQ